MKLLAPIFIIFCALVSNASEIKSWSDIEPEIKYHTQFSIKFDNGIELPFDTPLVLSDLIAGQAPVIYFEFSDILCKDTNRTAEMILVNPEPDDLSDDKSVGVLLDKDCKVGIYVEPRHFYDKSLLY